MLGARDPRPAARREWSPAPSGRRSVGAPGGEKAQDEAQEGDDAEGDAPCPPRPELPLALPGYGAEPVLSDARASSRTESGSERPSSRILG